MFCDQCGSKLGNDNVKFCPYCGAKRNVIEPMVKQEEVNNHVIDNQGSYNVSYQVGIQVAQAEKADEPVYVAQAEKADEPVYVAQAEKTVEPVYVTEQEKAVEPIHSAEPGKMVEPVISTKPEDFTEVDVSKALEDEVKGILLEEPKEQVIEIPDGFILDRASGWYYKSRGKQLSNGSYVNEITWFDPKTAKITVVDYPLSEQQVRAMLENNAMTAKPNQAQFKTQAYKQTQEQSSYQGQYQNSAQGQYQNTAQGQYQNTAQYQTVSPAKKKSKAGLIIGIVVAVLLLGLGFCIWKFEWYSIILGKRDETVKTVVVPSATPTPSPTPTATPTPTQAPVNPLGTLNEDYIVIGGQEFETTAKILYLDDMDLTNEDIEPLQYMKDLKFLYISGNKITSLDAIRGLTSLETLDASNNDIHDVKAISNLTKLSSLYLDHTQISDLSPLTSLSNLTTLGISSTQVNDLTPLTSLQWIQYLYVAESPVEDYSPLTLLPNLYLTDVTYESGNNGIDHGELSNFEFTEGDNLYFTPKTNNYLVISLVKDSTQQMFLLSYDSDGNCVQLRMRVELGYELTAEEAEEYIGYFAESEGVTNVNVSGSVIYFDFPDGEAALGYTKEDVISQVLAENGQIIVNVSE